MNALRRWIVDDFEKGAGVTTIRMSTAARRATQG